MLKEKRGIVFGLRVVLDGFKPGADTGAICGTVAVWAGFWPCAIASDGTRNACASPRVKIRVTSILKAKERFFSAMFILTCPSGLHFYLLL
jgi:hypothetical protein